MIGRKVVIIYGMDKGYEGEIIEEDGKGYFLIGYCGTSLWYTRDEFKLKVKGKPFKSGFF